MKTYSIDDNGTVDPLCMVSFNNTVQTIYYPYTRHCLTDSKFTIIPMWYERAKMIKLIDHELDSY